MTTKTVDVSKAAREAMREAASYREGAERLLAMARTDPALYSAIMEPFEFNACYDAVAKATADIRARIWTPPTKAELETAAEAVRIMGRAYVSALLDFPLPGGTPLRNADREMVISAAVFYRTHAADMAHKGRWLDLIATKLRGSKRVGEVLTEKALAAMQKETEK